jgi:glycosyltransferase involved in cell wall biosynthesis
LEERSTERPLRIISVGRLESVKGFDRLISAFARIAARCPQWQLAIYGHGSLESVLRQQISKEGLEQRVTIYPPTPNIYHEYQQSDIYVLSSLHEGFGMVLLEAMSCGLPCVAFDCPYGPGEILDDGVTGRLVDDGDEAAMASALLWMTTHREERLRMGLQAREAVKAYLIDEVMKRWQSLFEL